MNSFKIVVTVYNSEKWISKNIQSILEQDYANFKCIVIDDCSTDNTFKVAKRAIGTDKRFTIIKTSKRNLACYNFIEGLKILSPNKEDVIISVDGDDWLAKNQVLSIVAKEYSSTGCWLTYGNFVYYPIGPNGVTNKSGHGHTYNLELVKAGDFRKVNCQLSHLKTFKYGLFSKIKDEDLRDEKTGKYYDMAWDLPLMLPMAEMAREKIRRIADILYVYNISNPINEFKVDRIRQIEIENKVMSMPKYDKVDEL